MVSVPLKFLPPIEDDIVTLHIFESPDNSPNSYVEIDNTPAGTYPEYITEYTTAAASSATDWFAIQWENSGGVRSPLSEGIKGGTTTLVGEIVERVMLRNPDLNENIVAEEAESTISWIYGVDDPYSIDISTVSKLWLTELANLALVASMYVNTVVESNAAASSYTAGMISESSSTSQASQTHIFDFIDKVEKRALKRLGIGGSLIASIDTSQFLTSITGVRTGFDSSRLLAVNSIITEEITERDLSTGLLVPNDR